MSSTMLSSCSFVVWALGFAGAAGDGPECDELLSGAGSTSTCQPPRLCSNREIRRCPEEW